MDAGLIDEDGYVHVVARDDDVINVAGHRYPKYIYSRKKVCGAKWGQNPQPKVLRSVPGLHPSLPTCDFHIFAFY